MANGAFCYAEADASDGARCRGLLVLPPALELKRNLIAVLLAHSTNLGLTRMADACGIAYDILAWTAEWYVREETLRART